MGKLPQSMKEALKVLANVESQKPLGKNNLLCKTGGTASVYKAHRSCEREPARPTKSVKSGEEQNEEKKERKITSLLLIPSLSKYTTSSPSQSVALKPFVQLRRIPYKTRKEVIKLLGFRCYSVHLTSQIPKLFCKTSL